MKRKGFARELWQYVFDAHALINIEHSEGIKALKDRKRAILISEQVAYEVAGHPMIPKADPLRQFVERNRQIVTQFQNNEEEEYLRILAQKGIHEGEASVIAIALKRHLPLVIEQGDKKATAKAKNHGVNTLSWRQFLELR
jgi:predicted nucleic acid-binding protein